MADRDDEEFVSEPLVPSPGSADLKGMARGEPGLPGRFRWRGEVHAVAAVLETWKTSAREGHTERGNLYLRRHWFRIRTEGGLLMTVYCERQARRGADPKRRWFVYTVTR